MMIHPHSSHPWIARYSVRLLQLMPSMAPEAAVKNAIRGFPDCNELTPERAAELYVESTIRRRSSAAAVMPRERWGAKPNG